MSFFAQKVCMNKGLFYASTAFVFYTFSYHNQEYKSQISRLERENQELKMKLYESYDFQGKIDEKYKWNDNPDSQE